MLLKLNNNMKHKSTYLFLMLFLISGFVFFFVMTKTTNTNKQTNDRNYFSKIHYKIYGKIHSYTYLGGVIYTIHLNLDSAHFYRNTLSNESNFIGLYSKKKQFCYF